RLHDLNYRAATAVFGHLGVEWDLAEASDDELRDLGWWIDWYKHNRRTLLQGTMVRDDVEGHYFKGVVTPERAIYSLASLQVGPTASPGTVRFPGLDPHARYTVRVVN